MVDITIKVKVNKCVMDDYERTVNEIIMDTISNGVDRGINVDDLLHGGKDIAKLVPNYKQLMEREQARMIKFLTSELKEVVETHVDDILDYDPIWDKAEDSPVLRQIANKVKASKEFKKRVAKYADDLERTKLAEVESMALELGYELVKV